MCNRQRNICLFRGIFYERRGHHVRATVQNLWSLPLGLAAQLSLAADAHLQRLTAAGIDTAAAQQRGQFELRTWTEAHLRDGYFDPDRMRALILATLNEIQWVLAGPKGAAIRLGLNRSTLAFRMKKLGIVRSWQ